MALAIPTSGFTNELPIGIIRENTKTPLKRFSLHQLTVSDLKIIGNDTYKQDHPVRWLAETISRVVEEIEGVPVCSEFLSTKRVPEIVKQLVMSDVSYLLIAGHIFNLGSDVTNFRTACPNCRNTPEFNFDLSKIEVPDVSNLSYDTIIPAQLDNGWEFKQKQAEEMGIQGMKFTHYEFRLPRLSDSLRFESAFSLSSKSLFGEKVLAACLVNVFTEDGDSLEPRLLQSFGEKLLLELTARDMKAINRAHNEVSPTYRLLIPTECDECGREVEIPLDPNFLYVAV